MPKFSLDTIDFLPKVNACVNGGVFLILISALVAIKKGKRKPYAIDVFGFNFIGNFPYFLCFASCNTRYSFYGGEVT